MDGKPRKLLALERFLVGNSQLFASLATTAGQHSFSVCRCHSLTKTVFVLTLALGGLVRTLHKS